MITVIYFDEGGKIAGQEEFDTRHAALQAARRYVTRNGLNSYRAARRHGQTRYYHYYGDREAIVRDCSEGDEVA